MYYNILGLSPPYDLHWSINGACVHLTWKHSHTDEPLNGYYVSVRQENNHDHEQTAPDFVHLDRTVRSTNIQGLMPDSIYQVKVKSSLLSESIHFYDQFNDSCSLSL